MNLYPSDYKVEEKFDKDGSLKSYKVSFKAKLNKETLDRIRRLYGYTEQQSTPQTSEFGTVLM